MSRNRNAANPLNLPCFRQITRTCPTPQTVPFPAGLTGVRSPDSDGEQQNSPNPHALTLLLHPSQASARVIICGASILRGCIIQPFFIHKIISQVKQKTRDATKTSLQRRSRIPVYLLLRFLSVRASQTIDSSWIPPARVRAFYKLRV
jgi:hypothetical protein